MKIIYNIFTVITIVVLLVFVKRRNFCEKVIFCIILNNGQPSRQSNLNLTKH